MICGIVDVVSIDLDCNKNVRCISNDIPPLAFMKATYCNTSSATKTVDGNHLGCIITGSTEY